MRGAKTAGQKGKQQTTRTSVVLDPPLLENLKCLAQKSRKPQGQIIRDALRDYLEKQGLKPDRFPKLKMEISY